ncbi:MAG TPA: PKD domain-containing protein [Planctomycetota bacterium]|nr:PKD domain-containing protein [Planctomycetota bacterium]
MHQPRFSLYGLVLAAIFSVSAWSATYQVGAGKPYPRLSNVPTLAPGDIVEIYPGTYNEFKLFTAHGTTTAPITIRGVGSPKPIFDGTGLNVSGILPTPRALFQLEGHNYLVENIEFRNAKNSSLNGSGLRVRANNVTIRNCNVNNCEMGIMSDSNDNLVIESCDIGFNGADAYSHNLYLNGNRTYVRYCYIHDSKVGQNFKTRGHYTELWYNYISNSADGEVCLVDGAGLTTTANSNALMVGNIVVSKVRASTANLIKFVEFGGDTGNAHTGTLYAFNNTFVAATSGIHFFRINATGANLVAKNNIFYGSNTIVGMATGSISGSNNWLPSTASVPAGFTGNVQGTDPGFVNAGARDYHLTSTSACINRGTNSLTGYDGNGAAIGGTPTREYLHALSSTARPSDATIDIGAYERPSTTPNVAPVARISANPTSGTAPLTVSFSGSTSSDSDGTITSYAWNFGDGGTGSGVNVSRTYSTAGTYTARLTVTDNLGATGTTTVSIVVNPPANAAPVARITANPTTGTAPLAVSFSGSTSSDSDGTITSYAWSFGDGGTGSGVSVSRTYSTPGTYTARLTVTDNLGATGTTTVNIVVNAPPATAQATYVTTDTTTQGSWKNSYGKDGYSIANLGQSLPAYAQLSVTGSALYTWAASTTDVRAVQKPAATDRIAACWYSSGSFDFNLNLTDGQFHKISVYSLDWDSYGPRNQRLQVVDAGTGTVLDTRDVSAFSAGKHVVWNIKGNVVIRVTNLAAGSNAVVSGIFFGDANVAVGTGLTGTYFNNSDFTAQVLTRIDPKVDFNWGGGSPATSIGADTFSVRWTGQIMPRYTETYRFYTVSDDGVRLWINNQLVVNNWTLHAPKEDSGTIALTAGQKYTIRMEFFENGGGAVARLLWSSARQVKEAVPTSQLFPDTPAAAAPLAAEPVMLSPLSASPSPAKKGETVTFNLLAADLSDASQTVTWDFGDGTSGSGASATHAYTAPGVYAATVNISNADGSTSASVEVTVGEEPAGALDVSLSGSMNSKSGKESVSVNGSLTLRTDLAVDGAAVRLEVGAEAVDFTLDRAGRGRSGGSSFKLANKDGKASFTAKLTGVSIGQTIVDGSDLTVRLTVNGQAFATTVKVSAKTSGKTLKFKN